MKNYTKLLSEQMVTVMDKYNNYEETEKIVISYGMELFLNSVLKTSIYLLIGMVAGKGVEVILAMTIFGGVRKISGGRHVETDVGCFIMTGSIIFLVAICPDIINISVKGYALIIFLVNCTFICLAPSDEYFEKPENHKEKMKEKLKCILVINIIFLFGMNVGNYWRTIMFIALAAQGITLIGGKRK